MPENDRHLVLPIVFVQQELGQARVLDSFGTAVLGGLAMFDHSKSGPGAMDQSFNKGGNNHYNTIVGNCSRHNQFKTFSTTDSIDHFRSLWVDDSGLKQDKF